MGNSVYHFSQELAKLGHEITVFTPSYRNQPTEPHCSFPDFQTVKLKPLLSYGNAAILPQILWRMRNYDIIHLHYPFYGTAEFVTLRKLFRPSTRIVLYYHMDNKASGAKGLVFQFYRFAFLPVILHLVDEITCSSFDYIRHSEAGGYHKHHVDKFDQVPYGVDSERFKPGFQPASGGNKVILFVGGLNRQGYFKGVENLLVAFERISHRVSDCQLKIVGRGDMEEYYRSLASELSVSERIEFINNADDERLVECYQECDLAVLPSTDMSEAFGIVLLEAMACAKPVIASDLPGVRSVFENGKHGLLVEPGNVDDLVEKVCILLTDREMARRLGEAGRELVESKYSWARAGETLDRIYSQVKNVRA
jgi:glycosyltransferase involved in cell wall biosynthesis